MGVGGGGIKRCSPSFSQFCVENLTFTLFSDKKQSFTLKAYSAPSGVWKKGGGAGGGGAGGVWRPPEGLAFRSFVQCLSVLHFLLLFQHLLVLSTALLF